MNFNIVEGRSLEEFEEDFKKLYNTPDLPVRLISNELGITTCEYKQLRRTLAEKGEITLRKPRNMPKKKKSARFYSFNRYGNGFRVMRNRVYYGHVKTEEQAKEFVRRLRECGWDKSKAETIKKEIMKK